MSNTSQGDWSAILSFLKPKPPMYCPHVPTPKQEAFLRCESLEVLYGGRAGGGKSDALLMGALQHCDIPHYAAMLFRNTFSDLSLPGSLMDRSHDWLDEVPEAHWRPQKHQWAFPSGASITFGYLDKPNDFLRYKSAEFQYIGFDEVSEISEKSYRYLFSRLRRPSGRAGLALSKVPLRMRAASNPAPNWVRRRFIEEGIHKGRIFIPAGVEDNPYIDHISYRKALAQLDEVERARLERGDWYAEAAGAKFRRDWFLPPAGPMDLPGNGEVPGVFEGIVRYWDLAATPEPTEGLDDDPDYSVGALVGLKDGRLYVLDVQRFRKDAGGVEQHILHTAQADGPLVKIRIEEEPGSSGKIATDHYARFVLLGFDFDGHPTIRNKEKRADLWAAKAKRREVIFKRSAWVGEVLDELIAFPFGMHDDCVDAISGAYEVLTGLGMKRLGRVEIIV